MKNYTIIIPSRTENNIRVCLAALKSRLPEWVTKVLVYDNDTSGGVERACDEYGVSRIYDFGPFIFSEAINKCMSLCPDNDVLVMNDDAVLQTYAGLDELHRAATINPEFGIVSSSILGVTGNPEQRHAGKYIPGTIRAASYHTIVFICVHISRELIDKIGPLDERLIHYGWDDDLYCLQAIAAGYKLGVYDGCVVEHGSLPSTYRVPGAMPDLNLNRRIFESIVHEKKLEPWWPDPYVFPVD